MGTKRLKAEFLEEGKVRVKSEFWEVVHDPKRGGCIVSIRFSNGSGRNILLEPVSSYFGSFWDSLNDKATINMTERDDRIIVQVSGELSDVNKHTASGVKYEHTYEYSEGHVKIARKYSFEKGIAGVSEVGIGSMVVVPELNCFAARPSHVGADKFHATCPALWGEVDLNDEVAFEEKNIPMYLAVFRKGVEGIEFVPGYDLDEWTKQLVDDKDHGRFQILGESESKCVRIVIEPFNSRVASYGRIYLSGDYTFSSYLGLPMIPKKVPRRYMHMVFGNHPWPSDDDIQRWAYSGVNVVRLHNDYHPSGDFWHDGSWPPYDEKGMSELKRVIDTCHRYGIKIVPYFSLYEINPESDGFAEGYIKWRRTVDDRGSLIETYPPNHYYGFGMCLSSGWKEFLKGYVKKVVETLGFDGIYYDYSHYWFCSNRLHSRVDHSIIDDVIDFLEHTRSLVGEDGLMLLHQSGWFPSVIVENYADAHIMLEDSSHWREIPPLEEFPPNTLHLTFMNVAPKIPCPSYRAPDQVKASWDLCAKCSALGAFPWQALGPESDPMLALFEVFRAFDLSDYEFGDYTTEYVKTSDEAVKGAVYFNDERVIVVLANVRDKPAESFTWTVDLNSLGWDTSEKYHVTGSLGEPIQTVKRQDLVSRGIEDHLENFKFKAYSIVRYRADERYVLYDTRIWTDTYLDDKLTVETKGPTGQEATLSFHSSEKPREIRMNSEALEEIKDWTWNKNTKIGTVTYRYVDTEAEITIQVLWTRQS